jgi:hypothetical protein
MLPPLEKTFSKSQKIPNKNFARTRLDILCACDKLHGKPTFFVSCVKKQKQKSCAIPISAPKFIFFTQKKSFSHETIL